MRRPAAPSAVCDNIVHAVLRLPVLGHCPDSCFLYFSSAVFPTGNQQPLDAISVSICRHTSRCRTADAIAAVGTIPDPIACPLTTTLTRQSLKTSALPFNGCAGAA